MKTETHWAAQAQSRLKNDDVRGNEIECFTHREGIRSEYSQHDP